MIERELRRQLDLLFEAVRELRQANSGLIDRVQELECSEDYKDNYFEGVIEKGVQLRAQPNWHVYHTNSAGLRGILPPRLDLAYHSPDGFSWGYVGSGPAQLATAMLAEHLRDPALVLNAAVKARRLANAFMWQVLAKLPKNEGWSMTSCEIDDWLSGLGEL